MLGALEEEAAILAVLDRNTAAEWPVFFGTMAHLAYHALRLLVFLNPKSGDYAIVFESLVGNREANLSLQRTIISPESSVLAEDGSGAEIYLEAPWDAQGENVIVGPAGEVSVTAEDLSTLEPERSTVAGESDLLFQLLVRAYLREFSCDIWPVEHRLRSALSSSFDLGEYELFLESTAFEHVVGTHWAELDPDGIDAPFRKLPSESETYRSLARAIVARDPSLFVPGTSNLDWRLHLDTPSSSRKIV